MLNNRNTYVGQQMQPTRRTYPTIGQASGGPAISPVTPPKPTNDGGFAGTSPVNPTPPAPPAYQGPIVGPPAPQVPGQNWPLDPSIQPPPQQPPRDQLVKAIMGAGASGRGGAGRADV